MKLYEIVFQYLQPTEALLTVVADDEEGAKGELSRLMEQDGINSYKVVSLNLVADDSSDVTMADLAPGRTLN